MIKHVVMWTFKDEAEGASKEQNIKKFCDMLKHWLVLCPE